MNPSRLITYVMTYYKYAYWTEENSASSAPWSGSGQREGREKGVTNSEHCSALHQIG